MKKRRNDIDFDLLDPNNEHHRKIICSHISHCRITYLDADFLASRADPENENGFLVLKELAEHGQLQVLLPDVRVNLIARINPNSSRGSDLVEVLRDTKCLTVNEAEDFIRRCGLDGSGNWIRGVLARYIKSLKSVTDDEIGDPNTPVGLLSLRRQIQRCAPSPASVTEIINRCDPRKQRGLQAINLLGQLGLLRNQHFRTLAENHRFVYGDRVYGVGLVWGQLTPAGKLSIGTYHHTFDSKDPFAEIRAIIYSTPPCLPGSAHNIPHSQYERYQEEMERALDVIHERLQHFLLPRGRSHPELERPSSVRNSDGPIIVRSRPLWQNLAS